MQVSGECEGDGSYFTSLATIAAYIFICKPRKRKKKYHIEYFDTYME